MRGLSGLIVVSRSSLLRPGMLCLRGLCAAVVRPDVSRESRTVQPLLFPRAGYVSKTEGLLWANAPGKDSDQDSTNKGASDSTNDNGKKPNNTQQLKIVFKEYGAVAVTFHVGISLISLGIFYALVSSGLDMTSILLKIGFSEAVVQSKMAAGTSTFVLAYAVHKLFAPARISITLVSVPFIVRYFRRIGFFKPRSKTQ
ncbi:protein FAM210B, mitochondrial isoform X1 [Bombina bombina]|uniref:protein FAM210B, mitochondrial isoform X1 n=1 Tax=Bombina bombina TaxID=8345 RepID=UPI00235A782A|nr:protein FAM210B, mitochondrial isoform X1 [Bombina bombina]